jgi:two-component system, NarL family, nitrate/nitrite response regulator NarL
VAEDCGAVLIVDDDADFRSLVAALLSRAGFSPLEAPTGEEALAIVRQERPALVLLDVALPGVNGYEVCRQLREEWGEGLAIIFISGTRIESLDRVAGLLIGADDYILKPCDPGELLARLRRFLTRSSYAHGYDNGKRVNGASLTTRESEVLRMLGSGLGQRAIAKELVISPKTVGTHIQRILTKLGVHSRAEAVAHAYQSGLIGEAARQSLAETNGEPPPPEAADG